MADAAEARGSENVLVTSFTRAAAIEVASRDVPIAQDQIGTLHAFGYRSLGRPKIAEMHMGEWNELGVLSLQNPKGSLDEPYAAEANGQGNKIFLEYQTLRAKMVDRALWPMQIRGFAERWERWKRDNSYIDFQDMIEIPLRDVALAPGNPSVILADEAQDLSLLQWALLRKWGAGADDLVVVGDADQCLPVDERIKTPSGERRLGDLSQGDIVNTSMGVQGLGFSYVGEIARHQVDEEIYEIVTEHGAFRCTGEHHVPAEWPKKKTGWHYVYLEKDARDRWRIGITSNPIVRLRLEKGADGLLPLLAFRDREKAAVYEVALAVMYGVPQILFSPRGSGRGEWSQEGLDEIFSLVDSSAGAKRLLAALGKRWEGYIRKAAIVQGAVNRKLVYIDCLAVRDSKSSRFFVRTESMGYRFRGRFRTLREARKTATRFGLPILERWDFVKQHMMEMIPAMNTLPGMITVAERNGKAVLSKVLSVNRIPYQGDVVDIEVAGDT